MFEDNWFELEALRERQARIFEEHRKANGVTGKLNLLKLFPPGFYFLFKQE